MKLFIATMIAISLVPLAAAGGVGGSVNSYSYGDCAEDDYAFTQNNVFVGASVSGVGYANVYGATYCSAYPDWWTGETVRSTEIFALGDVCVNAVGCTYFLFDWYQVDEYCTAYVYSAAGYTPIGCPAGGPPVVPALIP